MLLPQKTRTERCKGLLIVIVLLLSAVAGSRLSAQSYSSVHYDTRTGLPSNTVYDITQDRDGFVWFATENGLARFDGKNFRVYTTKDGLPDNSILKVHGDRNGRVYFTPFTHGLYYYQNDSIFRFPVPQNYRVDISNITAFANKGDEVLVAVFENYYVIRGNTIVPFEDRYKKDPKYFGLVRVFDSLIVGLCGDTLTYLYDSGVRKTVRVGGRGMNFALDDEVKPRQLNFNIGVLIAAGLYLPGNRILRVTKDNVVIFDMGTGKCLYRFPVEKYSNAFFDSEDNLWISTLGNGVFRLPSFGFRTIAFDGKSEIFSVAVHNNHVLVGSDFSMIYQVPLGSHGSDKYMVVDLSKHLAGSSNPIPHLTRRNRIYVMRVAKDNLYIGSDGFLLKQGNASPPLFRNIFPVKDIDIGNGRVVVSTGSSVLLMDDKDMSIIDTLLKQRATCGIFYRNACYVGTLGGLIRIDTVTRAVSQLYDRFPAFRGRITAICRGVNDDIWVATSGSGLIHFRNDHIITTLREEDGLTSDICTSLCVDGNTVWLGTNKGLNRINANTGKPSITRFTSANGIGEDYITTVYVSDTNLFVGTAAGLTTFSKNVFAEKSQCILHILQVLQDNKPMGKKDIYSFPFDALNIQINFTAVSFKSAGDITYSYRLQGLNGGWNTTSANFVNFASLPPGSYTFLLKAVNKFGVESQTQTIKIRIRPPWWQTWIFRGAALLTFLLIVLGLYRYNIASIKRKEEMKREFEARSAALEQKALQAQMNPHFIFNCLNSIQTFILDLDVEGANNYLTNFASLIRQTLENSMQPLITVDSEVKYIDTYLGLEKLRFREKFRYEIIIDPDIDQNNTVLPGMLLQPYVENSLRHGIQHRKDNKGVILLTISKGEGNSMCYTITDNGVGRKKSEELKSSRHIEYQSRGISINQNRIAAINSQFKVEIKMNIEDVLDEEGTLAGTRVTLSIPALYK